MARAMAMMAACILLPAGSVSAGAGAHWEYDGKQGPEHWGELTQEYAACAEGKNQSPIDLVADVHADLAPLNFDYHQPGIVEEFDTGHSIQENARPGNYLTFLGERFELKQPVKASAEQIQLLHDVVGTDNNRPIQPHNSRLVLD